MNASAQLRIGELARRTGCRDRALRAWERRYGFLAPTRTPAGYRLYSNEDVRRVGRMRDCSRAGVAAAEAAREALAERRRRRRRPRRDGRARNCGRPSSGSTMSAAHAAFDRLLAGLLGRHAARARRVAAAARARRRLGSRERSPSPKSTSRSNLLRGRLLGLARGWDRGSGPRAVLACPPGERHDLGLLAFGLALREHGWRDQRFSASDTPLETLARDRAPRRGRRRSSWRVADPTRLDARDETAYRSFPARRRSGCGGAGRASSRWRGRLLAQSPVAAAARRRGGLGARGRAGRRRSRGGGSGERSPSATRTAAGRGTPL